MEREGRREGHEGITEEVNGESAVGGFNGSGYSGGDCGDLMLGGVGRGCSNHTFRLADVIYYCY